MGVSAAIFNTAGQVSSHYVPGVYSRSKNITSANGVSSGNLCILGESAGGIPHKLMVFGSLSEAKETLQGGELLDAVGYAMNGSNVYTPQRVYAIRVNSGTQATLTLKKDNNNVMKLYAFDYGKHTNKIQLAITTDNSTKTTSVEVNYGDEVFEKKNITRKALKIKATEQGWSVKIVTTAGKRILTIQKKEDNDTDNVIFDLEEYATLTSLAKAITGSLEGLTCEVLDVRAGAKTSELDDTDGNGVALKDSDGHALSDGAVLYSNVQALRDAMLECAWIGNIEINNRTMCNNTTSTFNGGSMYGMDEKDNGDGTKTSIERTTIKDTDWAEALDELATCDIQIIATPSTDEKVHTLIKNHCVEMSNVVNRKERTAILGGEVGTKDDVAKTQARALNSNLVSYVCDSAIATNAITGEKETISGAMVGCMLAGMESSMSVNEPLTNKSVNLLQVTKKRTISNMEDLIQAGIMLVNPSPEDMIQIVCIRAITTFQGNDDLISCERSMTRENLFMNRDLRSKFKSCIGRPNNISTADIAQTLKDAASSWAGNGYIITGENGNVWNIKVRIDGDKIYLEFDRYLTAPTNFVFITATNHVYTASVTI